MTKDDIIRMAREVGMQGMLTDVVTTFDELDRFAALVAAKEREECAKVCEDNADCCNRGSPLHTILSSNAAAIRARGNDA